MKRNQLTESANDQPASQVDDEAANDDLNESELQEYQSSAGVYERRSRHRTRVSEEFMQETWWIIVALYLILISVGLVVL